MAAAQILHQIICFPAPPSHTNVTPLSHSAPSVSQLTHSCFPIVLSLCHCNALLGAHHGWLLRPPVQFQSVSGYAVPAWCWIVLTEVTTCWCSSAAGARLASWSMLPGHGRPMKATRQTELLGISSSIKHTFRLYQPSMQRRRSQVSKLQEAGSTRGPAVNHLAVAKCCKEIPGCAAMDLGRKNLQFYSIIWLLSAWKVEKCVYLLRFSVKFCWAF